MNEYPCYNGGKDCADRHPGCQGHCDRYAQMQARNAALKAAMAPTAAAMYHGEKVRATAARYERKHR